MASSNSLTSAEYRICPIWLLRIRGDFSFIKELKTALLADESNYNSRRIAQVGIE